MCDDSAPNGGVNSGQDLNFATKLIHAGYHSCHSTNKDVVPPISLSTIYNTHSPGVIEGFEYTRCGNPIRSVLEKCLTALDNAEYALAYSTGMAATTCMVNLLTPGDHVLCSTDVYGGTYRVFNGVARPAGILFDFIDFSDYENVTQNITPSTKLVWFESVSNPLARVLDVKEICEIVHNIRADIMVVIDNSFVTPYLQRPIDIGADVVMYSISKYMNGHSDLLMGALVTNKKDLYDKLYFLQYTCGYIPSSFDCYLAYRGLKTLQVRMDKQMESAMVVAKYLDLHPKVLKVNYMGLPNHPQQKIIEKQFVGYNGMVSFYINGGIRESTRMLESLKLFAITCSLGCYESLAALPCKMTHGSLTDEERQNAGIHDNLIRLSIGLEYVQDLIDDLEQAFQVCGAEDKSK